MSAWIELNLHGAKRVSINTAHISTVTEDPRGALVTLIGITQGQLLMQQSYEQVKQLLQGETDVASAEANAKEPARKQIGGKR